MKIKQSNLNINKNKNINLPLNSTTDYCYNNEKILQNEVVPKEHILFICNNIDKLDITDHAEIYKLLRNNSVLPEFFSKTNRGVYFDFSKLSCEMQWKIYEIVLMNIENIDRVKLYEECIQEHNKHITSAL